MLLTNDGTLPLAPSPGRLALIGPLADAPAEMLGPWAGAGRPDEAVGVLEGLRAALPDAAITHVEGVPIEADAPDGIAEAVAAARAADTVVLALGEAAWMSGEAASRARIDLPGRQAELADAVLATGNPTVVLLFSGRPLAMPEVFANAAATLACWFPGTGAGTAVARLLTGEDSPVGRPRRHLAARRRPDPDRLCRPPRRPPRGARATSTPASTSTCRTPRSSPSATASPTPASP